MKWEEEEKQRRKGKGKNKKGSKGRESRKERAGK
jgi:hypothetical protein